MQASPRATFQPGDEATSLDLSGVGSEEAEGTTPSSLKGSRRDLPSLAKVPSTVEEGETAHEIDETDETDDVGDRSSAREVAPRVEELKAGRGVYFEGSEGQGASASGSRGDALRGEDQLDVKVLQ